jgi:hypothetical protein
LNINVLEHWSTPTKGLIFATVKICYIENREEQIILQLDAVEMECRCRRRGANNRGTRSSMFDVSVSERLATWMNA